MFTRKNRLLLIEILTLLITGLVMIASSSRDWARMKYQDPNHFIHRQIVFMIMGLFMMFLCSHLDLNKLREKHRQIFLACLASMVLVLIPGIGTARNGSRSWFDLGPVLVQPSEFFKLALILSVADNLAQKDKIRSFCRDLKVPFFLTLGGFLLILAQPDFGSGMVMVCSIVIMVLAADTPIHYFFRLGLAALVGLAGLILAAPYRLRRILSFLDPWSDPLGSGFQIIQSYYAIAPGGLLGSGLGHSIQKRFYLPEPQTDFIFSIACEELGWIGAVLIILLYILIIREGAKIALHASNPFLCFVAVGIISLFAIQVLINLGVVVGLFPVTGITLPLMSYGGSSVIMIMGSMGVLMSIANS